MAAPITLPRSRSDGMNTTARMPALAACAATLQARLPVEAHEIVSNPNSCALVAATDTTRSLNENEGLTLSFLMYRLLSPSRLPRLSALSSGVYPAMMSTGWSPSAGSRSAYRQILSGPASMRSRLTTSEMVA